MNPFFLCDVIFNVSATLLENNCIQMSNKLNSCHTQTWVPSHSDNQPLILNSAQTFSNRRFYNWLFNELIEHDNDIYFTYHISAEVRMLSSPSSSYLNTSGRSLSGLALWLAANWTFYSVCCCSPNRSQLGEYMGTPKQTWRNRPAHAFFVAIIFALIFPLLPCYVKFQLAYNALSASIWIHFTNHLCGSGFSIWW